MGSIVPDITQRLRAEYILDTSRVEAANERVRAGFERTEVAAQRLREEFQQIEQTAVTPSSSAAIAQIERDLAQPSARPTGANSPQFLRETMGLQNRWAMRDIERIEGLADPVVDGLYQMEAAFDAVSRADREAERQAANSKGTWGDWSDSLKRGAKDTFQPLTDMADAALEVGKGLGVIGGVAYGVVAAVDFISDAFSRSADIARDYASAVEGLDDTLRSLKRGSADFWDDFGLKLPNNDEVKRLQKIIDDIRGTPDSPAAPGEVGKFQKLDEARTKVDTFIRDVQDTVRAAGATVGENGEIRFDTPRAQSNRKTVDAFLKEQNYSEGDKYIGGYDAALDRRSQLDVTIADLTNQANKAEKERTQAFVGGLETMVDRTRDAFDRINKMPIGVIAGGLSEGFSKLGTGLAGLGDPSVWLADAKAKEQRKQDWKSWLHYIKTGEPLKTTIDARGAKITVNTRIDTDDPARFADVAIKSAFVATAARPLSATLAFGGPMVGGSKR